MKNLRELLDKIYEMEGLVHLAMRREDDQDEFYRLICSKSEEIQEACSKIREQNNSGDNQDFNEMNEENQYYKVQNIETDSIDSDSVHKEDEIEKINKVENPEKGEEIDKTEDIPEKQEEVLEKIEESWENTEDRLQKSEEYVIDDYEFYELEDENIDESEAQEFLQGDFQEQEQDDDKELTRGKLVFSINDRFRFRKELFDNSDASFNNSLALVASMENYEEAEDYFINDIGMNPVEPIVKEFLDIIRRYFK